MGQLSAKTKNYKAESRGYDQQTTGNFERINHIYMLKKNVYA